MSCNIEIEAMPSAEDLQVLSDGLGGFTESKIGIDGRRELTFFLRNEAADIVGGIKGSYGNYGWLWIDTLWVSEAVRDQGYGAKLVNCIEQEALKNGCRNVYLNSFSFSAVEFYKKLGYRVYAELEDFPVGHSVCSLRKNLTSESTTLG